VPSPVAGVIKELKVAQGDKVSEGTVLAIIEVDGDGDGDASAGGDAGADGDASARGAASAAGSSEQNGSSEQPDSHVQPAAAGAPASNEKNGSSEQPDSHVRPDAPAPLADGDRGDVHAQVVVLGSGPGGYSAAFRAADLGLEVVMIERYPSLGGVCLNVGCIPSKALLHQAKIIAEAEESAAHGITFGKPEIDLEALRAHKEEIVGKLTGGVDGMAKRRKVTVVTGEAKFTDDRHLTVVGPGEGDDDTKTTTVSFDHAIIAAGSSVVQLPGIPYEDDRVWDSTAALELRSIPERLLVIGGGIIGLEMATVYDALGSKVSVVELSDGLVPGCDRDLVKPLQTRIAKKYEAIHTGIRTNSIEPTDDGLHVTFISGTEGGDAPEPATYDAVLVAVGRVPNGKALGLDTTGVTVDERGFVPVNEQLRTNVPHILAIGDIVSGPMLAHKASHEAHVAAEVIAGENVAFDVRGIPSVAYTDPEVAWVGLTETQAKADGTDYEVAGFPWAASGRALAIDGSYGKTKLLIDPKSRQVLGAGIVGPGAGELIAEPGFAMEMGADIGDLALTIHAHPTLSESIMLAAEMLEGTVTDLPPQRKKR
jgi:dihydrolipoamide dehydrogenase